MKFALMVLGMTSGLFALEMLFKRKFTWPARGALTAAFAVLALVMLSGCGSLKGQVQLGSDLSHPDRRVVESHICRGENDAARLYLGLPEYAWMGAGALERYLTDAKDFEFRGGCACAGKPCANGGK
jgi:hypothetical protein